MIIYFSADEVKFILSLSTFDRHHFYTNATIAYSVKAHQFNTLGLLLPTSIDFILSMDT